MSSFKKNNNKMNFKSDKDIKVHFIERLKERYKISLSEEDYNDIHNPLGFTYSKLIQKSIHWAKLSSNNSAFILQIQNKLVLAIYSKHRNKFITALPWESYNDETRFVPKFFRKKENDLKEYAIEKYNQILSICSKEYQDFGSQKANWHYYKNCTYPNLLMSEYKGGLTVGRIYEQVLREFKENENNLIENL